MTRFLLLAALFGVAAIPAAAGLHDAPQPFLEIDYSADTVDQSVALPINTPSGILMRVSGSFTVCPKRGGTGWLYSEEHRFRGASFRPDESSRLFYNALDGAHLGLYSPPLPPTDFAGVFASGDQTCSRRNDPYYTQSVAFVAPSDNTYRLRLDLSAGAYYYALARVDEQYLVTFQPVTAAVVADHFLPHGIYVIRLAAGDRGATPWTIHLEDQPPQITRASLGKRQGNTADRVMVSFRPSESGNLDIDILRQGKIIRQLVRKAHTGAVDRRYSWDGLLLSGRPAPAGAYTIRITVTDWRARIAVASMLYKTRGR